MAIFFAAPGIKAIERYRWITIVLKLWLAKLLLEFFHLSLSPYKNDKIKHNSKTKIQS
jgi:hypothetical protein